jgi:hypothetical protein
MPDNFDIYSAVPPEKSNLLPPTVQYDRSRFDPLGRVLFVVPRTMPQGQCQFCHSSKVIDPERVQRWEREEDVHSAAGMSCVDCHRNGLDHLMVRGYEGEAEATGAGRSDVDLQGCHLGNNGEEIPQRETGASALARWRSTSPF